MLRVDVPGQGAFEFNHLVLDLNGTIATDGKLLPGVVESVEALQAELEVVVVTADTHGLAKALLTPLGIDVRVIAAGREAEDKLDIVDEFGGDGVIAIGNGSNDALMLRDAGLGIAVVGTEGAAREAVFAADVVVTSIQDALGMLLEPRRLVATLRR